MRTIPKENLPVGDLIDARLHQLFSTPIIEYCWPNSEQINKELRETILKEMKSSPGRAITSRGGWQSLYEVQNWDEVCVERLLGRILLLVQTLTTRLVPYACEEHLEGWKIEAWANANPPGAYNDPHSHEGENTVWSGIYYVYIGSERNNQPLGGETVFEDRQRIPIERIDNPDIFRREFMIEPKAGKMLLFPGHLCHRVNPYEGTDFRFTIAFNLAHSGFAIPLYHGMDKPNWRWKYFLGPMIALKFVESKLRRTKWLLTNNQR